jgi:DNA polymerase-3 subunit delta'
MSQIQERTYLCRMTFKNVIGQDKVKQQLIDMVAASRLSHALLFLGQEGSGALPMALAFAQYVSLLPDPKQATKAATASLFGDPEPPKAEAVVHQNVEEAEEWMRKQPAFAKSELLQHPDIHYSYPVVPRKPGDKPLSTDYIREWREFTGQFPYGNVFDWLQFIGAENKQGNITAYECNDIIHKLSLKSFESRYKVLVMWMPEYLGNEGNKLLKLIEEPPADTLFILVAENESLILPTIISRTQLIKIPPLEPVTIEQALVARAQIPMDQAAGLATICEGNYREALQLIQHASEDWQSLLREWLNAILKSGPVAQVKWVEEINKSGREKQKQFIRYFIHLLEQAIRLRALGSLPPNLPGAERDFAERLNRIADLAQQESILEELEKAVYYIERNANARMLFHALTIKLYHIIADRKVMYVR